SLHDALPIYRSFVRDLVTDLSDLAIVSAIIAMARHLHIEVVAEGIEGWQQLEKLRQLGCTYAQGYLFARPAPAQDCAQYLSGQPLDLTQTLPALDRLEATGSGDQFRVLRAWGGRTGARGVRAPRPGARERGRQRLRRGRHDAPGEARCGVPQQLAEFS